jgi:hypothetical protein
MANEMNIRATKSSKTEIIVKQYECAEVLFPKCTGTLTITNKRVLFHGYANDPGWIEVLLTLLQYCVRGVLSDFGVKTRPTEDCDGAIVIETDINSVSGLTSYYGGKINIIMLILGVIFTLSPIFVGRAMYGAHAYMKYAHGEAVWIVISIAACVLLFIIGITLLFYCQRRVFFLKIFSSQATGAPITLGEGIGNLGGIRPLLALVGQPTASIHRMLCEIGAIISDIKELGDAAIPLWTDKPAAKQR